MINGVVGSRWKYGSTVFAHKLQLQKNKKKIRSHRAALLLLTRSYRTSAYLPLTTISNTIPLDYQVRNRTIIYSQSTGLKLLFPQRHSIPETITKKEGMKQYLEIETRKE